MFAVFDIERSFDERICRTAREVTDFIAGANLTRSHFIVAEFDTADGWSRDVTDLFTADEPDTLPEPVFNHTANMRHIGAFSR